VELGGGENADHRAQALGVDGTDLLTQRFGFHSAAPLIALVYLCCSGIVIDLPR